MNLKLALFKSNTGSVSDVFAIEITPAGWVFSVIWTIIFIWQVSQNKFLKILKDNTK